MYLLRRVCQVNDMNCLESVKALGEKIGEMREEEEEQVVRRRRNEAPEVCEILQSVRLLDNSD